MEHLSWLIPAGEEPIGSYAARMRTGISVDRPVLLGVSFGGMMAIEIAKFIPEAIVIIVSSIRDRHQLPLSIRMSGRLVNDRWKLPANLPLLAPLQNYFLGVETEADARLAREYRGNIDPLYLQWAIRAIAFWQNEWRPEHFYHLHGTRDRTFPIHRVEPTHVIEGGGHLMIHNKAEEISAIIKAILGER